MATKKGTTRRAPARQESPDPAPTPTAHASAHAARIEQMLEQPNLSASARKELQQTLAGYRAAGH